MVLETIKCEFDSHRGHHVGVMELVYISVLSTDAFGIVGSNPTSNTIGNSSNGRTLGLHPRSSGSIPLFPTNGVLDKTVKSPAFQVGVENSTCEFDSRTRRHLGKVLLGCMHGLGPCGGCSNQPTQTMGV